MIIFPAIDLRQGRCVRLRQGWPDAETIFSEDPLAVARHWTGQGAEWLHVVNLDGAFANGEISVTKSQMRQLPVNWMHLREIASTVGVPIQFGGGLRDLDSIALALELGAARVILGTVAVRQPQVVAQAIERFGAERIVVSIDAREGRVAVQGWKEISHLDAVDLACRMRDMRVRRVVYTDIARDGMLTGINVKATRWLAEETGLQVIASGGVASLQDIRALRDIEPCGVEGVIVGQALYTGAISLPDALAVVGQA